MCIVAINICVTLTFLVVAAALHERYAVEGHHHLHHSHLYAEPGFTDTDSVLQVSNIFIIIIIVHELWSMGGLFRPALCVG